MQERKKLFTQMEQFAKVEIDDSIKDALVHRLTRMTHEEKLGTKELSIRKENIYHEVANNPIRKYKFQAFAPKTKT